MRCEPSDGSNRSEPTAAGGRVWAAPRDRRADPAALDLGEIVTREHAELFAIKLQAFLHARYFVEMAVKYAEMAELPGLLPSGWAALLCLYGLR